MNEDVYSLGIVLYFIFVGSLPKQSIKEKVTGKEIRLPNPSDSISPFCVKLIKKCMSFSSSDPPSFEQILIQLRENFYQLALGADPSILARRRTY